MKLALIALAILVLAIAFELRALQIRVEEVACAALVKSYAPSGNERKCE